MREKAFDIILSDYRLPGWTGMEAFTLIKEHGLDTPFVLVTGTLGEELAIECIKHGVTDYVLKDWQAAGLRAESCFRAFVITIHRSELTAIGHLSDLDWSSVQVCVRRAFAF